MRTTGVDGGVTLSPELGDAHHDDPSIVVGRVPLGETVADQPLHGAGGARRVDPESLGEVLHRAGRRDSRSSASIWPGSIGSSSPNR